MKFSEALREETKKEIKSISDYNVDNDIKKIQDQLSYLYNDLNTFYRDVIEPTLEGIKTNRSNIDLDKFNYVRKTANDVHSVLIKLEELKDREV